MEFNENSNAKVLFLNKHNYIMRKLLPRTRKDLLKFYQKRKQEEKFGECFNYDRQLNIY